MLFRGNMLKLVLVQVSLSLSHTRRRRYQERGSNRRRGQGMELVPSRRSPSKSSKLAGLGATMKGMAALMQEDAKGKVSRLVCCE